MEQILELTAELAVWGSFALLIWGAALCLHSTLAGGRKRPADSDRATRHRRSAVVMATD